MSLSDRPAGAVFLAVFCLLVTGCAAVTPVASPPASSAETPPAGIPESALPGALAALELTEEARILLDEGRTGDAIRLLERAVNIHPDNGRSYYYLAEAWIARGDYRQAAEFNGLAEAYIDDGQAWQAKIRRQRDRIKTGPRR